MFQSSQEPRLVGERRNSSPQNSYTSGSQVWSPGTVTCDCMQYARYFKQAEYCLHHVHYPQIEWNADASNNTCNNFNDYNQGHYAGRGQDFISKEAFVIDNSTKTSLNHQDSFGFDGFDFLEELCHGRVGEHPVAIQWHNNFQADPHFDESQSSQEMQSLQKATYTRPSAHVTLSPHYDEKTGSTTVLVAGHNYPTEGRAAFSVLSENLGLVKKEAGLKATKREDCLRSHEVTDRILKEEKLDVQTHTEILDRDEYCSARQQTKESLHEMQPLKMETDGVPTCVSAVRDAHLYGTAETSYCEFNYRLAPLTWDHIDVSNVTMTMKTDHNDPLADVGGGNTTYHELLSKSNIENQNIMSRNMTSSPTQAEDYETTAALPKRSRSHKAATSRLPSFSTFNTKLEFSDDVDRFSGSFYPADTACSINYVFDNTQTSAETLQGLFPHVGQYHVAEMDGSDTSDISIDELDSLISNHLMSERETALSPEVPLMAEEEAAQLMHGSITRPTKRHKAKAGCRIWEYIRDLLLNPETNPSLITWENRDKGVFKLVKSKEIAKIWGRKKGNEEMNYEKFSRAMRYHYKRKVFEPVIGKRLVYKFGPRATGWQTSKPSQPYESVC